MLFYLDNIFSIFDSIYLNIDVSVSAQEPQAWACAS